MENLGESIRKIREVRGISQRNLAQQVKTSQSAIARIEKGVTDPRMSTVQRIGKILQADLTFIVDMGEMPIPQYDFGDE